MSNNSTPTDVKQWQSSVVIAGEHEIPEAEFKQMILASAYTSKQIGGFTVEVVSSET